MSLQTVHTAHIDWKTHPMVSMMELTATKLPPGFLRPPFSGTLTIVPSSILSSACWTPSPVPQGRSHKSQLEGKAMQQAGEWRQQHTLPLAGVIAHWAQQLIPAAAQLYAAATNCKYCVTWLHRHIFVYEDASRDTALHSTSYMSTLTTPSNMIVSGFLCGGKAAVRAHQIHRGSSRHCQTV